MDRNGRSEGLRVESRMASIRLIVHGEKPAEERRQVERFSSKLSVDLRVLTLPCSSWQFKFAYYQKCIEYGIVHEPNLFGNEAKIYGRV